MVQRLDYNSSRPGLRLTDAALLRLEARAEGEGGERESNAMRGFLLRTAITALGLWVAAAILPGVTIRGTGTLLLAAALLGVVNGLLRPIVIFVTLPITIVTFGLFLLVINAALFGLVAAALSGFEVSGFFPALFGWLIVSLIGGLCTWFIGPDGRYQVLIVER